MTQNQIAYQNYLESGRHNVTVERETQRSNLAKETEQNRSNLAQEAETNRHNVVNERLTYERDMQTAIHNQRIRYETERMNNAIIRQNALNYEEVKRSNLAKEEISKQQLQADMRLKEQQLLYNDANARAAMAETALHNRNMEAIDRSRLQSNREIANMNADIERLKVAIQSTEAGTRSFSAHVNAAQNWRKVAQEDRRLSLQQEANYIRVAELAEETADDMLRHIYRARGIPVGDFDRNVSGY